MNNKNENRFALRKADRETRGTRRLASTIFRLALLSIVLSFYWQWNHPNPGIQLTLQRERSLAAANASFLFSSFGFLGIAAFVVALFNQATTAVDRLINRQRKTTHIR